MPIQAVLSNGGTFILCFESVGSVNSIYSYLISKRGMLVEMPELSTISPNPLSRIFSSSVVRELASKGRSPILSRLIREAGITGFCLEDRTIGELFDAAFDQLRRKEFRSEYVYKSAITRKILLGRHSLRTASMMTEFRVGETKADIVILNGTGTVYEIKSERDNLDRLLAQLEAYLQVFASVNVVAGEAHVDAIVELAPKSVGVHVLTNRSQISTVRAPSVDTGRTKSSAIFECMSLQEVEVAFAKLSIAVPELPNTKRYFAYKEIFSQLDSSVAHEVMVETLKQSRSLLHLGELLKEIPDSLHSISLSLKLKSEDRVRLQKVLDRPAIEATRWG